MKSLPAWNSRTAMNHLRRIACRIPFPLVLAVVALVPVSVALAARSPSVPSAPNDEVARRVMHLRDDTWFRGDVRAVENGYELREGAGWRHVDAEDVRTSRFERDLLTERARMLDPIPAHVFGLRVEACRWMIDVGLDAEAAAELDRVLHVDPAERHALDLLAKSPPRLLLDAAAESARATLAASRSFADGTTVTPTASATTATTPEREARTTAARLELLRSGARACATGGSAVRRELVVNALADDADRAALVTSLVAELQSGTITRREFACYALRRISAKETVGPLAVRAVLDTSIDVRDGAITALRDTNDARACAAVIYALGNPNANVRAHAAEALGRMGYTEAVAPLMQQMMMAASAAAPSSSGGGGPVRGNLYVGLQTAYVQDFNVEIAQGSSIADPIIQTLSTGVVFDVGVVGTSSVPITTEIWETSRALARLTGARIGADPPAWKRWWAENRERFVPGAKREPRTRASGG